MTDQADQTTETPSAEKNAEDVPNRVYLIAYPKIVLLYPTFLAALICGLYLWFSGVKETSDTAHVVGLVFMAIMFVNLVVFSFDFPRTTSLTLFFFVVAVVVVLWTVFQQYPDLLPVVGQFIKDLNPYANMQFYFLFAAFMACMYVGVVISVQFDYWEVRPNELLHHHGVLSNLKRYSAPNLRIEKEINDIFEYFLLRSGRLILHPSDEARAVVLDNVLFINYKENQITRILSALQVSVRTE